MIDISQYLEGVDVGTEPDFSALTIPGLRDETITITGTWDPDAVAPLAVYLCLIGGRAPRKSKKAIHKLWRGGSLTRKEKRRVSRLRFSPS